MHHVRYGLMRLEQFLRKGEGLNRKGVSEKGRESNSQDYLMNLWKT